MKLGTINFIFWGMGLFLIVIGIIVWAGKRIDLIHGDDANKVKAEDIAVYSRLTGIGVILIALGAIAYGFIMAFPEIPVYFQWIAVVAFAGLGFLIMFLSRKKYFNK